MSWAPESLAAIKRIILLEDRIKTLTDQCKLLLDTGQDLDGA